MKNFGDFTMLGAQPVLPVRDVAATIAYYRDVLGFRDTSMWGSPPTHGTVVRNRAGLQFVLAPDDQPAPAAWAYVFLTDVDALCAEYRSRGVEVIQGPGDRAWGMREFTIRDLNGNKVCFGEHLDELGGGDVGASDG